MFPCARLSLTEAMHPAGLLLFIVSLPLVAAEMDGRQVFETVCSACHTDGKFGAPALSDSKRWKKLVREGLDDLVPAALGGIRQMPARGGNPALSDLEVARGVIFMSRAGGGNFPEPTAADLARWRNKADKRRK